MSSDENLKYIRKALRIFPKIVKEKERQWREREKDIKRFEGLSKKLYKLELLREKKVVQVREHARRVTPTPKNPDGLTIVDAHNRTMSARSLSGDEILSLSRQSVSPDEYLPKSGRLKYRRADDFDQLIGFWISYFKNQLLQKEAVEPNLVKALIGSESSFDPKADNGVAFGLLQITRSTLKILGSQTGESRDFTFKNINLADLKDPAISIALGTRWLYRKRDTARAKLGRDPKPEEIILEYKGLLNSKTRYRDAALKKFRDDYELLRK